MTTRSDMRTRRFQILNMLAGMLIAGLSLWAGVHVLPALVVRDNPPLACQLTGGHWDMWKGWTCG